MYLINEEVEKRTGQRKSFTDIKTTFGVDLIKFLGGVGNEGYIVPLKNNWSEVMHIIIWNPDKEFEKVLSTLRFE